MLTTMPIKYLDGSALRDKARLNRRIARDLADCFGGDIADYLKRLNRNLKNQIAVGSDTRFLSDIDHADNFEPAINHKPRNHPRAIG